MRSEIFTSPRKSIRRKQLREMVPLAVRWSSTENFRAASLFHRAASSGTSRKSEAWLAARRSAQSLARNLPMSGNGARARFDRRVRFKQRH